MKKMLIFLFSVLFLSSVCFAEEAPPDAPSNQTKVTGTKTQGVSKKSVKPAARKTIKKSKKQTNQQRNKKKEIAL